MRIPRARGISDALVGVNITGSVEASGNSFIVPLVIFIIRNITYSPGTGAAEGTCTSTGVDRRVRGFHPVSTRPAVRDRTGPQAHLPPIATQSPKIPPPRLTRELRCPELPLER